MLNKISWFRKYKPNTIDEYCFENDEDKKHIMEWIQDGFIPGNVILYGPPGVGKSALSELLIKNIIKNQSTDLKYLKGRKVTDIEALAPWLQQEAVKSKQKIVYIEEFDRIRSQQAIGELKSDLMEKYQQWVIFLCTTNYLNRIDSAIQTRFTWKLDLGKPILESVISRLEFILNKEEVVYDSSLLKEFIEKNIHIGMRDLINNIQINSTNKELDLSKINIIKSEQEQQVIELTLNIIAILLSNNDLKIRHLCLINPVNSVINTQYASLLEIIEYNTDIDYDDIFLTLSERVSFLPITFLINKYISELENKKLLYIHYLSFIYEMMKAIIDINI